MGRKWDDEWERDSEVYSPNQVESVIRACEVDIDNETNTHFLAFCPFHNNTEDPAFAIDKRLGLWTCFNPSCANSGTLEMLVKRLRNMNQFEAYRFIMKYKNETHSPLANRLEAIIKTEPDFVQFPEEPVRRMTSDFSKSREAQEYMMNRGFSWRTLEDFEIGYSAKRDMVVVPMHDPSGMLVGFVGRSIEGKIFKNSDRLPKSKTAWNFHRAKKHGETVIVTESSFDAMRVHQAGYPNVVALLGGHASGYHLSQLGRTFSTVIIATDFDHPIYRPNCRKCDYKECKGHRPGRDLGRQIAEGLPNKRIKWAAYDDEVVYPHDAKDMGDMTDNEIRQCLHNAVGLFEYARWNPEVAETQHGAEN